MSHGDQGVTIMVTKTNKKDWSDVIWLFGWMLNFANALKKLALKLDVPFEAFLLLTTEEGEGTLIRVLQLILQDYYAYKLTRGASELPQDHYRVYVTYANIPSMRDLKLAWGLDNVSSIFDGRPFRLHSSCRDMSRVPGKKIFYLHDAGSDWASEERIAWGLEQHSWVAPNGYRPATEVETYEFSQAYPEFTEDYAGLGAFARDGKNYLATRVWWLGRVRYLCEGRFDGRWDRKTRVLFVAI